MFMLPFTYFLRMLDWRHMINTEKDAVIEVSSSGSDAAERSTSLLENSCTRLDAAYLLTYTVVLSNFGR
jgi:hypothetical protein